MRLQCIYIPHAAAYNVPLKSPDPPRLKFIDLGQACRIPAGTKVPADGGTPAYLPFNGRGAPLWGKEIDTFAFALVLIQLLCGLKHSEGFDFMIEIRELAMRQKGTADAMTAFAQRGVRAVHLYHCM